MMSCEPIILIQNPNFHLAQCQHCHRIGLYYHNLLASFEKIEFLQWSRKLVHIKFWKNYTVFPSGQKRIVIETCHHDLQFSFSDHEFREFRQFLTQSILLLEAQDYLSESRN